MKKYISLFFIVILLCCCSCSINETYKFDNIEQKYDKNYEEVEHLIVDEFGDYLYVYITSDNIMVLALKGKYIDDKQLQNELPDYMIFERTRGIVNSYILENPNCTLAEETRNSLWQIHMLVWEGHSKTIFEVNNNTLENGKIIHKDQFITYMKADSSSLKILKTDYNSYVRQMMDYIAKTGSDLNGMVILVGVYDEKDEALDSISETMHKFPCLKQVIIYYSSDNTEDYNYVVENVKQEFNNIIVEFM